MSALAVTDVDEVQEAIRERGPLLPRAGGTHPATLPDPDGETPALEVGGLEGVVDYDPAELTFTARPGTPLREIEEMLAANGQHLPFDPPSLGGEGSIGGAIAAGVTGPNGFGAGIRDFIIGVRFVDRGGRLAAGGGKVVKNAAGFDLPKLMVGSLGRLGVLTEVSLKVFPRPEATATVRFSTAGLASGLAAIADLARGPVPLSALDLSSDGAVTARLGGDAGLLDARAERLAQAVEPFGEPLLEEASHWEEARRFGWVGAAGRLVVVPLSPGRLLALDADLERRGVERRYGLAANVAWIAWPVATPIAELSELLVAHRCSGVALTGQSLSDPLLGAVTGGAFARRVAAVLGPVGGVEGTR